MITALALALSLLPAQFAAADSSAADSVRSDAEIREFVLRHVDDVRRCYQTEGLSRNPALSGMVEVELTIQPTGVVHSVIVDAQSLPGAGRQEVAACIARVARNWRFQRGPFDTEIHVLPFTLAPQLEHKLLRAASIAPRISTD